MASTLVAMASTCSDDLQPTSFLLLETLAFRFITLVPHTKAPRGPTLMKKYDFLSIWNHRLVNTAHVCNTARELRWLMIADS